MPAISYNSGRMEIRNFSKSHLLHLNYVLKNKRRNWLYIGYTSNVKRRLSEHKEEEKRVELIYFDAYIFAGCWSS